MYFAHSHNKPLASFVHRTANIIQVLRLLLSSLPDVLSPFCDVKVIHNCDALLSNGMYICEDKVHFVNSIHKNISWKWDSCQAGTLLLWIHTHGTDKIFTNARSIILLLQFYFTLNEHFSFGIPLGGEERGKYIEYCCPDIFISFKSIWQHNDNWLEDAWRGNVPILKLKTIDGWRQLN